MGFKNKDELRSDRLRKQREEVSVEIRRAKREESLLKRRNLERHVTTMEDEDEDESGLLMSQTPVCFAVNYRVYMLMRWSIAFG